MKLYKSLATAIFVAVVMVSSARAGIYVAWQATGGFVPSADNLNVGILTQPENPTGRALAQLIFSPGAQVGPALFGGEADLVSGDNQVLASWVLELGAPGVQNEFAETNPFEYSNPVFTPGAVFVRIFGRDLPDIGVGTRYYDSSLINLVSIDRNIDPPPAPQLFEANRNTLVGGIGDELNMTVALIPEPGTFGLLAIGVLGATLRRRRLVA